MIIKNSQIKKEAYKKPPFFISYLITDPDEFGNTPLKLKKSLRDTFSNHKVDIVCFRDKKSSNKKELAKACLEVSRHFKISKVLINSEIELCNELGFDGIHLNSQQFDKIETMKSSQLYTVISCHNEEEIIKAKELKVDAISYSPIFFKELKGKPKGIINLSNIVKKYQSKNFAVFALGGIISNKEVEEVIKTNVNGFASIRYFKI